MAADAFIERKFKPATLKVIRQANVIIAEYQAQRFTLTLRQLYYQFVARGLLANKQKNYKRLGSIINDARLAGLVDWGAIEDRVRNVHYPAWDNPESALDALADQYLRNPWHDQPYWPEVWVEKDALLGVILPACTEMRCPALACRGYVSASETYGAGQRLSDALARGQRPIIFHLGDHDPSGIDMTRDNRDRVRLLARDYDEEIEVVRLALNFDQVEEFNPPPNPAKDRDARFRGYKERFGTESWELDALEPAVIKHLIVKAVEGVVEWDAWEKSMTLERRDRLRLKKIADRYVDVVGFLEHRRKK